MQLLWHSAMSLCRVRCVASIAFSRSAAMHKIWAKMSFDEKKGIILEGRRAKKSDEAIGEGVGARKGQIVGFRHRHLPELTGKSRGGRTADSSQTGRGAPGEGRGGAAAQKRGAAPLLAA